MVHPRGNWSMFLSLSFSLPSSLSKNKLKSLKKICFQDGSLRWLLAGSLSSLPCGSLLRAAWPSLQHVSWLLLEQVIQKKTRQSYGALYDLTSEIIVCHFCNVSSFMQISSSHCWGGVVHKEWIPRGKVHREQSCRRAATDTIAHLTDWQQFKSPPLPVTKGTQLHSLGPQGGKLKVEELCVV